MFRLALSQSRNKNCAAFGQVLRHTGSGSSINTQQNLNTIRSITNLKCLNSEPSRSTSMVMINSTRSMFTSPVQYDNSIVDGGEPTHRPSDIEKKILVYTKNYAKVEDVPEKVSFTKMKVAKDKFRVMCAIWFMVVWAVSTAIIIAWGKRTRAEHLKEEAEKTRQRYIEEQKRQQEAGK